MIKISKEKYFNLFNQIEKNKLRICPLCNLKYEKKCELKKITVNGVRHNG